MSRRAAIADAQHRRLEAERRAADFHGRADVMDRMGYRASAQVLRSQALAAEDTWSFWDAKVLNLTASARARV